MKSSTTHHYLPLLLITLLTLFTLTFTSHAQNTKPNILFLFADDQRPDSIGAYNNPHIQTPNIDKLANSGFNFMQNYCMGSMHGAVCQPSRAMLNSGRTLYRVPMNLKNVKILPELLADNGYVTFGTGKWHNGGESFARGFHVGKNVLLGGMSDHTKVPIVDVSNGKISNKRTGDKFSSELFADAAVNFLDKHQGKKPFYAYVSFTSPHDPRQPPKEHVESYYKNKPPLPKNFLPQHPFNNGHMVLRDEVLAAWPRDKDTIREQLAEYYGMITHMDAQIGRIITKLKEKGFDKNTIIIYSADHGLAMGSHGLLGKQNLYEHSMGCPLIFVGPNIPKGKTQAFTYLLDIYPTLCDMLNIKQPSAVEGKSLHPLITGKSQQVRDSVYTSYAKVQRAVRTDHYKLIRYPQVNHTQLFDLKNDPNEMNNLASKPEHADKVKEMLTLLEKWQNKVDDKLPLTSKNPKPLEIDLSGHKRKPDRWQPQWIVDKYFKD